MIKYFNVTKEVPSMQLGFQRKRNKEKEGRRRKKTDEKIRKNIFSEHDDKNFKWM